MNFNYHFLDYDFVEDKDKLDEFLNANCLYDHPYHQFTALTNAIDNSNLELQDKKCLKIMLTYLQKEYPFDIIQKLDSEVINVTKLKKASFKSAYFTKIGQLDIKVPEHLYTVFDPEIMHNYELPHAVMLTYLLDNHVNGLTLNKAHDAIFNFWGASVTKDAVQVMKDHLNTVVAPWRCRSYSESHYYFLHADMLKVPVFKGDEIDFANLYTITGIDKNGRQSILTTRLSFETEEKVWKSLFEELFDRGMNEPLLLSGGVSDDLKAAAQTYYPKMRYQICSIAMRTAIKTEFDKQLNTDQPIDPNLPDVSKRAHKLVTALYHHRTDYAINVQLKEELIQLTDGQPQYQSGIALLNRHFEDCFTYLSLPVRPNQNYTLTSNNAQKINNEIKRKNECPMVYASIESAETAINCHMMYLEQEMFFKTLKLAVRD